MNKKEDIKEMVSILKTLDHQSLLILCCGAQMLKARREMEIVEKEIFHKNEVRA